MTTFKAVNGWTDEMEVRDLSDGLLACVYADPSQRTDRVQRLPCTIIPGHWAERIESGELLTEEETVTQILEKLCILDTMTSRILIQQTVLIIARKLRGEA